MKTKLDNPTLKLQIAHFWVFHQVRHLMMILKIWKQKIRQVSIKIIIGLFTFKGRKKRDTRRRRRSNSGNMRRHSSQSDENMQDKEDKI